MALKVPIPIRPQVSLNFTRILVCVSINLIVRINNPSFILR